MADEQLPPGAADKQDDEISLLDLAIVLAKHQKLVLGLPLVAAVVTAIVTLFMPNVYTATARIMPPQQSASTAAAMLNQLGGALGGLSGGALGIKNPNDLYVGMLESRTVADRLIERFKLKDLFDKDTLVDTRTALAKVTSVSAGKDGLITIEVDDKDPKRAAAISNAYVEELDRLNDSLAVTEASQRRLFFEKQLRQSKDDLASAEIELKKTQEKTGLIKLDDQGKAIIDAVAQLKAQVAAKEVQIGAMKSFATGHNPELVRTQQELTGLREQLRKLERDQPGGEGDILVPTGRVPEVGLEYIRKARDVKYYETLFELLAKQYEVARLDEARNTSLIQVLDKAVPPDKKSKPKRVLIVVTSALVAGLFAVLWAFAWEGRERAYADPLQAQRLHLLKRYLGRRTT